jgi:hypothetical protein
MFGRAHAEWEGTTMANGSGLAAVNSVVVLWQAGPGWAA